MMLGALSGKLTPPEIVLYLANNHISPKIASQLPGNLQNSKLESATVEARLAGEAH